MQNMISEIASKLDEKPIEKTATKETSRKYFNPEQAADFIGKHPKWLERKRWEGGGPIYRYVGKTPIYEDADIINWMNTIPKVSNSCQTLH